MPDPYEIATWRFECIAALIDKSLSEAQRRAALRKILARRIEWPGSTDRERRGLKPIKKKISKSSIHRWIQKHSKEGYKGLLPAQRSDKYSSRQDQTGSWIHYAIGLLYEQPGRSLTQIELYLSLEFPEYSLSRSSLHRHLQRHPSYPGIAKLRGTKPSKLRDRYEASDPHESWQLDGKGGFTVSLKDGSKRRVHVISILDDYSRSILAATVEASESSEAAIAVFDKAALAWGLPERMQFDHGSAFDSHVFRQGLAQLGVHRNAVKARHPEAQGKIEAYHRSLIRWFIQELEVQVVVDLEHLQELLDAMLALIYNKHQHREIGTTPEKRLAGRRSTRLVTSRDLLRVFSVETNARSDRKTGEVKLPVGIFRVPAAFAGMRCCFRHHPIQGDGVLLISSDGREIAIERFERKPLSVLKPKIDQHGNGQLQKLLDLWRGRERPNAEPGFGLPEIFVQVGELLGREIPQSEYEANLVGVFYREHGSISRDGFLAACKSTERSLGKDRPLSAYLEDLARQITNQRSDEKEES